MYTYRNGVLYTEVVTKNAKLEEDLGLESIGWLKIALPISKESVQSWREAAPEGSDSIEEGYVGVEIQDYGEIVIKMTFDEFSSFYDSL